MSSHRDGLSSRHGQQEVKINIWGFDDEIDDLRGRVSKIKQLSLAIDDERKEQGEIISSLESTLEQASGTLKVAMTRLNRAYRQAKRSHMLVLLLFSVGLILLVYVAAKIHRVKKTIIG